MDSTIHTLEEGLLRNGGADGYTRKVDQSWLKSEEIDDEDGGIKYIVHEEKLSVDEMLRKWVGEFGMAQFMHFMLVSLAWTLEALHTMVIIFADGQPEWRCLTSSTSSPASASRSSFPCSTSTGASTCRMDDPSAWEWVGGKSRSIVSEWGLTCEDSYKVGLVDSMFFVGAICGAGIFGSLSDSSLGRKGVLQLVCVMSAIAGLATAFSPNYWIYLALRWMTGVSVGGVGLSSFVLATEPVGLSKRGAVGMSTFYFFSLGIMVLPSIAYVSRSWRHLYFFTSLPSLLYSLLVLPFISECPRWYIVQGCMEDAMKALQRFAKGNSRSVIPVGVELASEIGDGTEVSTKASGSLMDVFRYRETRMRMVVMAIVWFTCSVVYYGITLNVVNIGVNLYLSVFLNAVAEMPAFAITALLLAKLGRKAMLAGSMLLSGGSCLLALLATTSAGSQNAKAMGLLACGVVGIFCMAATYNLVYLYTAELFPTVVRNAALGLASQTSQMGAVAAPLVVALGRINRPVPFVVFAVAGITGGLLSLKLPETLNKPMWETMEGLKKMTKESRIAIKFCIDEDVRSLGSCVC